MNAELIKQARLLALQTKRACVGSQYGEFQRKQQGSGFEFDQLAEYHHECDTRFIDWKSSARVQKLLVRQFKDERQRKILLVVDSSSSVAFGSQQVLKGDIQARIAAILAYASYFSHDAVGCIWFDETVHTVRTPRANKNYIMQIVYSLLQRAHNLGKKTNFNGMLRELLALTESNLTIICISDFIGDYDERLWSMLSKKHTVYALRIIDPFEQQLPRSLPFILEDAETGVLLEEEALYTLSAFTLHLKKYFENQNIFFKKNGIRSTTLLSNECFIRDVIKFFKGIA